MPNNKNLKLRKQQATETQQTSSSTPSRKRQHPSSQYEIFHVEVTDDKTKKKRRETIRTKIEVDSPTIQSFINFQYPLVIESRKVSHVLDSYMLYTLAQCLLGSDITKSRLQKIMAYDILNKALSLCPTNQTDMEDIIKTSIAELEVLSFVDNYLMYLHGTTASKISEAAKARTVKELLTTIVDEIRTYVPENKVDVMITQLQQDWVTALTDAHPDFIAVFNKRSDSDVIAKSNRFFAIASLNRHIEPNSPDLLSLTNQ